MKRLTTVVSLMLISLLLVGEPVIAAVPQGTVGKIKLVDYVVPIPLPELCGDTYLGEAGCLYPGSNEPPAAYAAELTAVSNNLANDSQVVVLSLGMSMMQNASNGFMQAGYASGGNVNPAFRFVNGAIGSKQQNWIDPNNSVWNRGIQALAGAGLNASQVDAVIYHNANAGPSSLPFPDHAVNMKESAQVTMGIIQDKYPNVKLILVTNRHYALAADSKHPEPYAYEEGFSWKWLVEERINCTVNCGVPIAWLANQWVPTWANFPQYYVSDGLHLSPGPGGGQYASADIWYNAMSTAAHIAPWYLAGDVPTVTPTIAGTAVPTSTPGATVTPSPFPSATATGEATVTVTPRGGGCGRSCQTATAEAGN